MIKFAEFMPVEFPGRTKVKFNMNAGDAALRAWDYLRDDAPEWIEINAYKRKHANSNLNHADYLLAFAQYYPYGPEYYIFGGMYRVEKMLPEVFEMVGYKLIPLPDYSEYRKRLIIKLSRTIGRDIYNKPYLSVQRDFDPEVFELLPIVPGVEVEKFHSYSWVNLTHKEMQAIIQNNAPEWKNALSSVKGIYCITDCSNGQLYIGSATGDIGGIWQRWSSYADVNDLTGGNKAFEELKSCGANRIIDNFTYSILEIFDMRTNRSDILARERYWKQVFRTIEHGMNYN